MTSITDNHVPTNSSIALGDQTSVNFWYNHSFSPVAISLQLSHTCPTPWYPRPQPYPAISSTAMHIAPMYPGKPSSHPSQKSCTLPRPQHEPHFIPRLPPSLIVISFPPKLHPLHNLNIIQLQLQTRSRNLPTPISPDLLPAAQELLPVSRRARRWA